MQNRVKPTNDGVKGTLLRNQSRSTSPVSNPQREWVKAHLGDIRYNGELELVAVFAEDVLEVGPLRLRPDGSSDGVTCFEQGVDDMDGGKTVRAGDEDFTS